MALPKYQGEHLRVRAREMAKFRPGQLCARCKFDGAEHPLMAGDPLELDHGPDGKYLGLSHRSCNRRAGGKLGAAGRRAQRRPVQECARCCMCGLAFIPSRPGVVSCGRRACVAALKRARRAREDDPVAPPATGREW
jgi:hypothetical protein